MKNDSPVGLTIAAVRAMTRKELDAEGWEDRTHGPVIVLVMNDGTLLYPSCDYEGNGPGAIFGVDEGKSIVLTAPPAAAKKKAQK